MQIIVMAESCAATGEAVWRMPLGSAYDKLIDSKFADMKNTGGRNAGSITAAHFIKRFTNDAGDHVQLVVLRTAPDLAGF